MFAGKDINTDSKNHYRKLGPGWDLKQPESKTNAKYLVCTIGADGKIKSVLFYATSIVFSCLVVRRKVQSCSNHQLLKEICKYFNKGWFGKENSTPIIYFNHLYKLVNSKEWKIYFVCSLWNPRKTGYILWSDNIKNKHEKIFKENI